MWMDVERFQLLQLAQAGGEVGNERFISAYLLFPATSMNL